MEIQAKSSSATEGFKQAALAEWFRLNPKYARPGDGVCSMFVNGFREGLPGHFFCAASDDALASQLCNQICMAAGEAMNKPYFIRAEWDSEAQVWVASSDDVPGLVTEADTIEALDAKLQTMVPELLQANGCLPTGESIQVELFARRFSITTLAHPHT